MAFKLAILFIFAVPAFYFGIKYTLMYAYQGIIKRRIGETTGYLALLIGIYSLVWAIGFVYAVMYLLVWFAPNFFKF